MKNYSLFFISICIPTVLLASRVFDVYKKAVAQYARDTSPESLERLDAAYTELMSSSYAGKAERLNAPYYFQQMTGSSQSLEKTLEEFRVTRERKEVAELATQLSAEKERLEIARRDVALREKELETLKAKLESIQKARTTPEREAQYEQLRTTIRSLKDTADITAATPPAAIQSRMDRLFELYARADHFAQITKKPADEGLRKSIVIPLRNLFALYQGPDGKRGDASIRNAYRARIGDLLNRESITTIKMPPTAEDIETLD